MVISKGQDRHSEGGMGINRGLPAGSSEKNWALEARGPGWHSGEPRSTPLALVRWARMWFWDDDFDSRSQWSRKARCNGLTACYLYVHYMYGRNRVRMGSS
jgi:hypothetical protein